MSKDYYRLSIQGMTCRELWTAATNKSEILLLLIFKTLRIPVTMPRASEFPSKFVLYAPAAIPEHIRALMQPSINQCRAVNMTSEYFHRHGALGLMETYQWTGMAIENGASLIAEVTTIRIDHGTHIESKTYTAWVSVLSDGTRLATINQPLETLAPATTQTRSFKKADALELLDRHRQRLAKIAAKPIQLTSEQLKSSQLAAEQQLLEHLVQRRVLVKVPDDEVRKLRSITRAISSAERPKLAGGGSGWSFIFVLMISIGTFMLLKSDGNQGQLIFRSSIVAIGLLGFVGLHAAKLLHPKPTTDTL